MKINGVAGIDQFQNICMKWSKLYLDWTAEKSKQMEGYGTRAESWATNRWWCRQYQGLWGKLRIYSLMNLKLWVVATNQGVRTGRYVLVGVVGVALVQARQNWWMAKNFDSFLVRKNCKKVQKWVKIGNTCAFWSKMPSKLQELVNFCSWLQKVAKPTWGAYKRRHIYIRRLYAPQINLATFCNHEQNRLIPAVC